jgi:hypothetical protein
MAKVNSREDTLRKLVPRILGIICEKGQKLHGLSGHSVRLGEQLELSGSSLDVNRIMLSVYSPVRSKTLKVFSAHLTDLPGAGDPNFYRYLDGSVGLMSWRRGGWEDAILVDAATDRSPAEACRVIYIAQKPNGSKSVEV